MSDTVTERSRRQRSDRELSLRINDLTKIFEDADKDEVVAVDDLTIDVYEGEFLVLVGPSGCGKTTTLRTVAGLEEPTEGQIIINGRDVSGLEPRERDVSMVFQNYALYPHKTVRENIAFPLKVRKYPDEEITRRVEETAELLDIPELLDRQPRELSGGQQQRVALGRAIVRDPELFLFDEPLSNLDAKLRIQMRTELNKLHERVGKTSVYVTHDQAEAMTLGDRIAVLEGGRLQQIARPQELYEEPVNEFVAGFIGEPPMNFFDIRYEERADERYIVANPGSGEFELRVPQEFAEKLTAWDRDPRNLVFGFRPDNVQAVTPGSDTGADPGTTIDAYVKVVEPMGSHQLLTVIPRGADETDEAAEFTAEVTPDIDVAEGDVVTLTVDMPMTHIFDGSTGENITL